MQFGGGICFLAEERTRRRSFPTAAAGNPVSRERIAARKSANGREEEGANPNGRDGFLIKFESGKRFVISPVAISGSSLLMRASYAGGPESSGARI